MKKVLSVDMVSGSATQNGQMTMKPTPKPTCSNVEEAGIEMVCIQLFVFTEMMIIVMMKIMKVIFMKC